VLARQVHDPTPKYSELESKTYIAGATQTARVVATQRAALCADDHHVERAELWVSESNRMVEFMKMARAAVSGTSPTGVGKHTVITP
jgi:hypothetical protein